MSTTESTLQQVLERRYYPRGCTNVMVDMTDEGMVCRIWKGPEMFRSEKVTKKWLHVASAGDLIRDLCERFDRTFPDMVVKNLGPVRKSLVGPYRWVVHS